MQKAATSSPTCGRVSTGSTTVVREGINISAGFTANVEAELRVGGLAETERFVAMALRAPVSTAACTSVQLRRSEAARRRLVFTIRTIQWAIERLRAP